MIIHDWLLTPHRVAIHRPTATAVVADLHLGYQEARRSKGDAVPLVNLNTLLAPLLIALREGSARDLIIAGDLFEKAFDANLWERFAARLAQAGVRLLGLVPGNHDRGLGMAPPELPLLPVGFCLGAWRILHGNGVLPEGKLVLGHYHPCIRWRGRKVSCYLAEPDRLLLPAYSLDAAGVNIESSQKMRKGRLIAIVAGKVTEVA